MGGFFLKLKELFSQKTWHCGRGLLVAVVLLALCGMQAWGVDYYWAGGGAANDWNDPNNWNPNTGYPQAGDNVYIYDGPLTFNQAVQAATITVNAYSLITFNGNADLGTVYVHGGSSLDFAAGVTINDLNVYANGGTSNIPINIGGASSSIGTYNFFDNGSGLDDASTITVASGASLDIGSGTIPTLVNEGTVNATGSVTVNDYRGSGSNTGLTILSGGGTPTTYYWIGEGTANTWNDKDNWSTDDPTVVSSPTPATDFPKSGDTAIFNTADAHSFSENITVAKIECSNSAEIAFSGTVAVSEIENNSKITSTSSLTLNGYSGTGEMESRGTITVDSASNVTISKLTMVGDSTVTNSGAGGITIGTLGGAYTLAIDTNNIQCTINGYDETDVPSLECSGNNMRLRAGKISSLKVNTAIVVLLGNLNVVNNVDLVVAGGSLIDGHGQSLTVGGDLNIDGSIGGGGGRELSSLLVNGKTEIKTRNRWDSLVVTGNVILGDGTGTDEFVNNGTVNVGGNLTINGDATNSGTIVVDGTASTVTFGGDFDSSGGTFTTATDAKIVATGTGTATLNFGANAINVASFDCEPSAYGKKLTVTGTATNSFGDFTAIEGLIGNAEITFDCKCTFNKFTADKVGKLEFKKANTFTDVFTNSGNTKITFDETNTFNNNFVFSGDGESELTLTKANTFNGDFTFTKGKTLTVVDTQTFTSPSATFSLSGTDADHLLEITGSGHFVGVPENQTATYLNINKNVYINNTGTDVYCTAKNSKYSTTPESGDYNGWRVIGDTITWTGATDTDWENADNWDVGIVPGKVDSNPENDTTGFKVKIPTGCSNYPLLVGDDYFVAGLEISGKVTFSGAGRIKDNSASPVPINDTANDGTIEYTGGTTLTDFGTGDDYANLIVASGVSLSNTEDIVVAGTTEINDATLEAASIAFNGNVTVGANGAIFNADVTLDASATMTVGSGGATVTFGGNFTNSGTYSGDDSIVKATGSDAEISGNGITAASFTYEPAGNSGSLTLSGANEFTTFIVNGVEGTLTVNDAQTVTGTTDGSLILKGTSTTPLTITGTGQFNLVSVQTAKYLVVGDGIKICNSTGATLADGTYLCKALFSEYSTAPTTGVKNGWCIVGDTITWTGGAGTTVWTTAANWDVGIVPGVAPVNPSDEDTTIYKVVIPVKYNGSNIGNYPVAADEYKIVSLTIGGDETIADSMATGVPSVTLGADNIILTGTPSSDALVNYGKIIYSGAGRITDGTKSINDVDSDHKGTVEYTTGATTLTDFASDDKNDYYNLIIDVALTSTEDIIVAGKTEINAGTVTAKSLRFKGDVEDSVDTTINGSVFIFGNGNTITASGPTTTFTIANDFILLGKKYNVDDNDTSNDSPSGTTGLFAYNHSARDGSTHAAASYTGTFPDSTTITDSCNGNPLTVADGSTITVGKNFYANGIEITGGGTTWTLNIPDNNSQTAAFAELYNSKIKDCTVTGGVVAAAENCTVDANCTGIETKRMVIKEAKMIYDDVLKVTFAYDDDSPVIIENSDGEIAAAASQIKLGGNVAISVYTDEDCTTSVPAGDYGDGTNDAVLYLKAATAWNTDATGISAGNEDSTNRSGTHSETIPYLNIPKALNTLYETLRDNHKNRIAHYYSASPSVGTGATMSDAVGQTYTKIEDECAPVLIAVYTGQENHVAGVSQPYYDAHNFIEFRYSEPVDISDGTNIIADNAESVQAFATLGAIPNSISGIAIPGLGTIPSGKMDAALKDGSANSPHSLYRKFSIDGSSSNIKEQPCRIRISIAGYVDGTVTGGYKNWVGYINSTVCPSAGDTVTIADNDNIVDRAKKSDGTPINNPIYRTPPAGGRNVPEVKVNAELVLAGVESSNLYGTWDVTTPSFAPMRVNEMATWTRPATDGTSEYEVIGMSYSGGMLSAVEIHMFDNEPTYTETLQWFSRVGWAQVNPSEPTEYDTIVSEAADVIGGSRPYGPNKTSGGIRYCSIYDSKDAFIYSANEAAYKNFSGVQQMAKSSFFNYIGGAGNPIDGNDGHYLSLALDPSDSTLTGETTFTVKFDSDACFITDLAGNRIQCGNITMKSLDRTPPAFSVSSVPLGNKKMLIIFSKAINLDNLEMYIGAGNKQKINALEYIPKSLSLKDADGNPTEIQITNEPAEYVFRSKKSTGIVVTLNRNAVLNDLVNGTYITVEKGADNLYDPLSGTTGEVTYIQDEIGNFMRVGSQHAFSDFAVNAVQMQYAYPIIDTTLDKYDLDQGTFIMRDWNAEQEKNGCVNEKKEIILHGALYDGTGNNSGGLNDMLQDEINKITAYFDASPNPNSVSSRINNLMQGERTWRIWLPNAASDVFENLASENNIVDFSVDGEITTSSKSEEKRFINIDVPEEVSTEKWKADDQVSFLFKLGNYEVRHNGPDEDPQPLYCLRLKDTSDLTSLDLWSFKLRAITLQRGGVTILANVINVNAKEKTTVQVDMQEAGNLSVMVMTLDGNIVKYLHHGKAEKGSHYYMWDGTNNGGSPVARGLYFVRVIGPGIDETRKVMCVKK